MSEGFKYPMYDTLFLIKSFWEMNVLKKVWDHKGIIEKFEANRNEEHAGPMKAYMKNHFPFLGIKSPFESNY